MNLFLSVMCIEMSRGLVLKTEMKRVYTVPQLLVKVPIRCLRFNVQVTTLVSFQLVVRYLFFEMLVNIDLGICSGFPCAR